jgi:hypothetical protein
MSGEAASRSSCSTILLPPGQVNGERGDTGTRRTLRRASLPHRLLPSPLRDLDAHEMGRIGRGNNWVENTCAQCETLIPQALR